MTKMRAMTVPAAGSAFKAEERDLPEPGRHEVRLKVQAATGVTRDGGYATHMVADISALARLPDGQARFRVLLTME